MILPEETAPMKCLYFIGAQIIQIVHQDIKGTLYDVEEIYDRLRTSQKISFDRYIYALTWLFLIGSFDLSNEGLLKKCF